jgi:hydrogenase nickel incorporation protein HypB
MHDVRFSGEDILARQLELADANYRRLREKRIRSVSVLGAIGSGKTTLVEQAIDRLHGRGLCVGTIAADSAGDDDHRRFVARGASSVNVNTQDDCHLDAHTVSHALDRLPLDQIDVLFIENVGNLICPTSYDLGEDFKVALLSAPEGDDKPFKYPATFAQADVTVITKADLLPHLRFDLDAVRAQVSTLCPGGVFVVTSAVTGEGLMAWIALLEDRLARKRAASTP